MESASHRFLLTAFLFASCSSSIASAQLTDEESQIDTQIQETWVLFLEEVRANDAQGAAEYFTPRVRKRYLEAFQSSGDELHKIADGWSRIKAVSLSNPFAEYTLFDDEGDKQGMFLITFAKSADGSWMIASM